MGSSKFNSGGNAAKDEHPIQGGAEILAETSWYRNWAHMQTLTTVGVRPLQVMPINTFAA